MITVFSNLFSIHHFVEMIFFWPIVFWKDWYLYSSHPFFSALRKGKDPFISYFTSKALVPCRFMKLIFWVKFCLLLRLSLLLWIFALGKIKEMKNKKRKKSSISFLGKVESRSRTSHLLNGLGCAAASQWGSWWILRNMQCVRELSSPIAPKGLNNNDFNRCSEAFAKRKNN